jgi:hypothetical protein
MKRTALVFAAVWLAAPAAFAGALLATETRHLVGEDAGRVRKGIALFDGSRMRIDTHDGRRAIVYRGDRGLIWIIDHKKKSYLAVEKPSPEALAREVQSRMESLSPEERAAAEAAPAVVPKVSLRETGATAEVQGIRCQEVEVLRGEERIADVCRASYDAAGVQAETFTAVREVQQLLQGALGGLVSDSVRSEGLAAIESFSQIEGVPMRVRSYRGGQAQTETLVTGLEKKALPETDFAIPAGYQPKITISITGSGGS